MNGTAAMHGETAQDIADIPSYLYNQGFRRGAFSDTRLVLHPSQRLLAQFHTTGQQPPAFPVYSLHALLLARSPTLFACLARQGNHPPPYTLHLEFDDAHLTVEGLDVALGTLYSGGSGLPGAVLLHEQDRPAATTSVSVSGSPTPSQTSSGLHVGLLAAAQLLGLHGLAQQAWQACTTRWRTEEGVAEGIRYALSMGYLDSPAPEAGADTGGKHAGRVLLDDLLEQLVRALPSAALEGVLVSLPFPLVKQSLEHEQLQLSSMDRHNFARRIVEQRRQAGVLAPGVEESVVMAFGGDSRSGGIEILRRERGARKKQLWRAPQ
ncbi:hypothetical protein BCR37DRAFT_250985 [Protomyces lactucae-debilis]|uniref:BTB domain-containing protein n=1 Tax=Protomyces lactucae-debilis TaxID=2754530 RepID=A0A1Y2FN51_PROLT|nr:uncharacterized protein BCR37DRAFT_250985 [Protomyces lactucae-debilis]ORY84774.1 hypothetical protein BCR37DRAFT_250985 [Protomyces lactucae-debilis]